MTMTVFSFGRFKGQPVTEATTSYLNWCVDRFGREQMDSYYGRGLFDAILAELARRGQMQREWPWTRRQGSSKLPLGALAPSVN